MANEILIETIKQLTPQEAEMVQQFIDGIKQHKINSPTTLITERVSGQLKGKVIMHESFFDSLYEHFDELK